MKSQDHLKIEKILTPLAKEAARWADYKKVDALKESDTGNKVSMNSVGKHNEGLTPEKLRRINHMFNIRDVHPDERYDAHLATTE